MVGQGFAKSVTVLSTADDSESKEHAPENVKLPYTADMLT